MQAKIFLLLFAVSPSPLFSQSAGPATVEPQFLPYTVRFKATLVQVLASGTTTTKVSTIIEARDSRGRTASITTPDELGAEARSFTVGHIREGATGKRITWDSRTRTSQTLKEPPPEQKHGCWESESGLKIYYSPADAPMPLGPTEREDLGKTTIEGVEVQGVRLKTTIPAGRIGNNQPIVSTSETWYAASLGLVLRSSSENPPTGKMGRGKKELVSLDRHEPDPSLFRPPTGYEAVTDKMTPCK
jgi:hypothetical protein